MATIKQKKIAILKKARQGLASMPLAYERGICFFVYISTGWDSYVEGATLRRYITKSLGEHKWLSDWLKANNLPHNLVAVRKARLEWIDWMIASLERK